MPGKVPRGNALTEAELEALLAETTPTMPGRARQKDEGRQGQPNAVLRGRGATSRRRVAGNKRLLGE